MLQHVETIFTNTSRLPCKIVADVDGLLENSYRALGLSLDRSEAEALISLLDVNGDRAIQCEELEVRVRLAARGRGCDKQEQPYERSQGYHPRTYFPALLSSANLLYPQTVHGSAVLVLF